MEAGKSKVGELQEKGTETAALMVYIVVLSEYAAVEAVDIVDSLLLYHQRR